MKASIEERHRGVCARWARLVVAAVLGLGAAVGPARAQQAEPATRAESLRQQREAKAQTLAPPEKPGLTAKIWEFIEDTYGPSATQWAGFSPSFGSVTAGGGFSLGGRYRNTLLFDRRASVDVKALGSFKQYYMVSGKFRVPRIGGTPLFAAAEFDQFEYPQEDFFGLGSDTAREDRSNFLLRDRRIGGRVGFDLFDRVVIGGTVARQHPGVGRGEDSNYPSIEQQFTDAEAPGLSSQPPFLVTSAYLDINRVGSADQPRTGGQLLVSYTHFADQDSGLYTFDRADVDFRHFIPFFQGKRVFVVRGWLSTIEADEGRQVPFYLQPFLGGRKTLRGYDDQRFRGPHMILLQAEYRFEVWPALDIALFVDSGEVEQRRQDLNFKGLRSDYGVSFRFGGERAIFRVDFAYGGETRRYSVAFGDVF